MTLTPALILKDERELLLQLQGDQGHVAFTILYERYANLLYNRIKRLVHRHDVTEELIQDVFLKIWQNREKLDPDLSLQVQVLRYAKSTAINFYHKAVREQKLRTQLIQAGSVSYDPLEADIAFKETSAMLHAAIEKLPPQRRRVFVLCKLEGKSYAEVAELLGIGLGTVKDHMAKAVRTLREDLSKHAPLVLAHGLYLAYLLW
jgi:RNA polymerase sigma-70 factor (family 1)